jgi:hypothetical protein
MTIIRTLTLATLLASALAAQAPPATPAPQPKSAEPDLATLRAMKSKLFVIQFRDSLQLQRALSALGSGTNGATMRFNNEGGLNTIGVRDFPENLALIEEAIKRLDVPAAVQKAMDVELHVQVLFASKQTVTEGSVPEELQGVIKSLKSSLAYRSYTLAASFIQRWDPSSGRQIEGKGRIDGSALTLGTAKEPSQLRLEWSAFPSTGTEQRMKAEATLQIPRFQFAAIEEYDFKTDTGSRSGTRNVAQMETGVSLKEGEYAVVGTSMIKDRGLIVVLSARRVN